MSSYVEISMTLPSIKNV